MSRPHERQPGARAMWQLLEAVHAVVYFAPEVTAAYRDIGLKGFWRGYFAGRAAPLGDAPAEVVTATFFGFDRAMVDRAVPAVWEVVPPADVLAARLAGVDRVLRRVAGDEWCEGTEAGRAAELAAGAVTGCSLGGRPLFAAHAALPWPEGAHLRLWHAATLLREHRGDGHVVANVAAGCDGLTAHLLLCASGAVPRSTIQPNRGWSDEAWVSATDRLVLDGLLGDDGRLTPDGRARRAAVEDTTDRLAAEPWDRLGAGGTRALAALLRPAVAGVVAAGAIPFPNPMGLSAPPT